MATIEKLVKAFEGLKVFQPVGLTVEDVTKKKDQPPTKKEKSVHCNMVADCICAPNMRSIPDFPKFLGIAVEAFLMLCDDPESDVRMVSDECLNRTIKTLIETNLGRLQVELYKEIKKNGPSRSLRAALWRFAEMCNLIRPQKCRPYIVNLMPCLARICKREEEAVQETLATTMVKICPVLISFANDAEVKGLLRSFLPNLGSSTAVTRRTAATSLTSICQHSRSPNFFSKWLLESLLGSLLPASMDYDNYMLLGVIQCLRYLLPLIINPNVKDEGMKGSFGMMRSEREVTVSTEQLLQVYELLLYHSSHGDHNVVTASLEALQQFLKRPHPNLVPIFTSRNAITASTIFEESKTMGRGRSDSSFAGLPSSLEYGLEDDMDQGDDSTSDQTGSDSPLEGGMLTGTIPGEEGDSKEIEMAEKKYGDAGLNTEQLPSTDDPPVFVLTESQYSNVEIGDVNEEKSERSEKSQLSHSSSQDTLLSIKSLSPKRTPTLRQGFGEDMNGNPEYDPEIENGSVPSSPYPGVVPSSVLGEIGTFIDGEVPLLYCTRLLCQQFLLAGRQGELMADKAVRISIKSLALGCVANITSMYPSVFFHNLFIKNDTENQKLQDILSFASHSDPQLKGQTALIIGQFIHATLLAGKGNFFKWVNSFTDPVVAALELDDLLKLLSGITEDESSMAARLGLVAIKLCLSDLLSSGHCHRGLQLLLKLIELKNHTYWLVKVEMLELLGEINFNIIGYLESVLSKGNNNMDQCIGELNLQERVVSEVMMKLLGDEDSRVRHSAATMLVRMVPKLFYKADCPQESPVIGSAKQLAERFLSPILHDWSDELPPLVLGLVSPYDYDTRYPQPPVDVESSLSRIISNIVQQLHKSQSKFLTNGCCHALSLLADEYMVTQFPHAWGCAPPLALSTRDSPKGGMRKPTSRSISSTSSTISFDEIGTGCGGGPLPIILSLLTSASFSLDLLSHQDALHVAGHVFAGAAYRCLRSSEDTNNSGSSPEEGPWRSLTDRMLPPKADQLLSHVTKLLNACTHVIEEIVPGPPQMKPSLPSLPNAPSLSPIKRRSKAEKDLSNQGSPTSGDTKNTAKQNMKDKDKESDKEKHKKDGIGTFYSLPHYMKLYDVLKGAYSNYKTSLELTSSDKFCSLLHTALVVLSQTLEVVTLQDIGKHAEELLSYLKSTVLIEATVTVQCVQQLLKALFGTNLSTQWEPPSTPSTCAKPGKATRLPANIKPGLYQSCFATPYTQLTQSLAGATFKANTQVDQEDNSSPLSWLRRRVDRKIPAILRPGSKTDKNAITSYIRLFEPLVIKALKQYTVTSSVELQTEVLDLLSQLIQLRVNYCLLDSDQIFIGFVIKQFEFIEEGQIRSSELVIPHIFQFLVILSYEKFHTKSIIGIPKIIQLCDGIMASGQQPTTHVIPALRPIVYDLFLLRGSNKGETAKELDTQREVVVSMLLRLISYYQVLELLTIVLHQYHKEGEDKWKRLSRQVTDLVLPLLTKQQINLDSHMSVDVLHRLFESVAPSVFRPVDILLKALFTPPQDLVSVKLTQRWLSLILGVLRVLISQSKEEVILARLQELHLSVSIFIDAGQPGASNSTKQDNLHGQPPEEIFAWYILQVVGLISRRISENLTLLSCEKDDNTCQGLAHLLLYLTYMFQSGVFRRVATAAMRVIRQSSTPSCFFTINQINGHFHTLGIYEPTLTLQWCNTLILLNYDDQDWWGSVMQTPKKYMLSGQSSSNGNTVEQDSSLSKCFSSQIIRRGSLILFCDYVCENLTDADHMIWVIINHVNELIELSHEPPVQDFISAVHRNSAASGLFIQAIHARCDNFTKPAQMKRTLRCLEAIHLSQSGTLLTLLIDKFLHTHHLAVARFCDTIACRRVEMLLAENLEDSSAQLPLEDLEKLLQFMKTHGLCKRHARLVSLLTKLRTIFCPESCMTLSPEKTHPLVLTSTQLKDIEISKDWFVSIIKEQCFCADPDPRECARLLQRLEYADTLAVIMTKEFNLSILKECISLSAYRTLVTYNRNQELREASPDESGSAQPLQQPVLDILFLASQMALFRHIKNIINVLPSPHQVLVFDAKISSKGTHYGVRMEDLFLDTAWLDSILQIAVTVLQYLRSLSQFPWQPAVPTESRPDVCRFCLLCLEVMHWQLSTNHLPSSGQLETAIQCMAVCLQSPQLAEVFSQKDFTLWACTAIGVTRQILSALVVHPGEKLAVLAIREQTQQEPITTQDDSYYFLRACEEMSELIHCLRTCLRRSDGREGRIPDCLRLPIRTIVIGLARLPVVNSYTRTPPLVWRMGWMPAPGGETKTRLPPLPLEYIQDKEVLREFIFRVHSLGWTSRQQFEETWMALLGVLTPLPPEEDHHIAPEEDLERSQSMVLAVRAITGLLIQSSLSPQPGNPSNSGYEVMPRDKPLAILHTRCGKKLAMVRGLVERELRNLCPKRHDGGTSLTYNQHTDGLKFLFESNLERELGSEDYALGQISVETIWSLIGLLDISASESESEESGESPPKQPQNKASTPSDTKGSLGGLDIHSCLQLLLELYGQWLAPNTNPKTPLMMLNAIVKSIVCLSDLFSEVQQYEWMLSTLLDVIKTHPVEDELINQYLVVGICKAAAVCGPPDSSSSEKIVKLLDFGLKSTHLPCKVTSLHGILYLLEAGMSDFTKSIISLTTDFLLKQLSAISLVCITSHQFVLTLWATAFHLIENYTDDLKEADFQGTILQMAVNTISSGEENISIAVYLALFRGLERLLLSDVLSKQDADTLLKLAVDRLCLPSPVKALPALGLMLTCMYTGKHLDQYSPAVRNMDVAPAFFDHDPFTIVYQDPESLILAMERVTVLFDRIKKGTPYEARVITRILPAFLADFFPPQDIMNKVIGEFISNQQPHPQLIAKVVFQVFSSLHQTEQHNLVQDWVMLSLSNFTQRTPVAMAVWSLTCFLISASTNPWLRGLLPHIIGRMGKLDVVDRKFFCVSAIDFYRQLDVATRRAFLSTFQAVAQPDSPYSELLACFSGL